MSQKGSRMGSEGEMMRSASVSRPSSSQRTQRKLAEEPAEAPGRLFPSSAYDLMPVYPGAHSQIMSGDGANAQDRPLDVTDALGYLDAVKVQFHDRPDVYNQFLDIMKDFKSQIIDTPGVIQRVSSLFRGHPALIQGFNTFLPPGYRIECSSNSQETNLITVTTPTGTTTRSAATYMEAPPRELAGHASTSMLLDPNPGYQGMPPPSAPPRDQKAPLQSAMNYVQKIKLRFTDEPDTYRQFLEALNNHADEQEALLARVEMIFKDERGLFEEFKEFVATQRAHIADMMTGDSRAPTPESRPSRKRGEPSGSSTAQGSAKRKRKPAEKENAPSTKAGGQKKGKQTASHNEASSSRTQKPPSPRTAKLHHHQALAANPNYPSTSHSLPLMPPPNVVLSQQDESNFFDRVKRMLDSRETFNEFLKIVNLFTQDIIDRSRLIKESRTYLGSGELMAQFMEILGWDERKEAERISAEQLEQAWVNRSPRVLDVPRRVDLSARYGSYRRLPENEINVTCSGRDDMCKAVLNDEWVSHPTFASEDSGFVAHKKNVYEEALHRSEEERHEYDFHIEAITRTISALEPINNKIAQLSAEERSNFKLKANLGGVGKSIHQRVIKKIYGREAGLDVIQAMQDSPALAIPVVLGRLKQKEEEWKRAQREWNKVWREVDARNYEKSLDHQGITFKMNDKKATSTKAFLNQIEAARDEQIAKRAVMVDPLFSRARPRHQLEYFVEDISVLQDALRLTLSFLDRTQNQIGFTERRRIEGFIRLFVPMFFMLDHASFNAAFIARREVGDSETSDEVASIIDEAEIVSVASSNSRNGRGTRKMGGGNAGDLRKKLLKSEQAKSTSRRTRAQELASPNTSRPASPALTDPMQVDAEESKPQVSEKNGEPSSSSNGAPVERTDRKGSFFTNTIFYVFIRLVELLYSRLLLYKHLSGSSSRQQHYAMLLDACERLFDNDIEQHSFEDQMRQLFGPRDAYRIFTVDKVIGPMIKQIQLALSDSKSMELYELLKKERAITSPVSQDYINLRKQAEAILGPDENLFRIDWYPDLKSVTIQLLGKDDASDTDPEVLSGRWQAYLDSFVSGDSAAGLPPNKVRSPFLRRNLPQSLELPKIAARGGLEIKVCVRTYRLFFVSHTEDVLFRTKTQEELDRAQKYQPRPFKDGLLGKSQTPPVQQPS
ncbi:hypothetical protein GLOTRDRAFT_139874 [Gloeophyllum trabeum ATCC 11539]|uniref:Histone deacetylase interacting domain-containing protein n=1 Tax=Gloeophyllum trabeum (strain ATCC 11539 / FP-39264 / Madison 617) TaxID=670483 RepID=S7RHI5_GLOTA|nr:uncharacterized protein GLOTRDRAFT_139874 [Gloeophyllum trabeum ATCC 11539]EPQ53755.1 hypothetical protein GLOTRDRAFT_139874 [Gloeophyllum trabeum ATCC 11539]